MSFIASRILVLRAGGSVDCSCLPWKHFQCRYSIKQKKVSNIIRWNTENKFLFGSKQTISKRKAPETALAKGTRTQSENQTKPQKVARSKNPGNKENSKATLISEAVVDFSETGESTEWYEEDSLMNENKKDMFHLETAYYNKLIDSGKAYEGVEGSSASWNSTVDIPELLPIPQGKGIPSKTETTSGPSNSVRRKSSTVSGTPSASTFKGADFIQQFPLLPSQFEEVRTSAEEFHGFVESLKLRLLPTVNTVLNKTRSDLSSFFLQRWRENMIKELGEAGFKKHQEATIWQGTNLHACVQQYLSGVPLEDIQVQEKNRGHWDSISSVLSDVTDVQALETSISHPWLCYKGTFDCIAKYKNMLYVIDWKTSSKPKPLLSNLYDNPLQVAAYLGAINLSPELTDRFGVIEQAAIMVAYSNGEAAHVHRLQPALCQHYWKEWCLRLHQYWATVAAEKGL